MSTKLRALTMTLARALSASSSTLLHVECLPFADHPELQRRDRLLACQLARTEGADHGGVGVTTQRVLQDTA